MRAFDGWQHDADAVHGYIHQRLDEYLARDPEPDEGPALECDRCGLDTTARAGFLFRLNERTSLVMCPRCYRRRGFG